jgi:hypothetical protein
MARQTMKFEVEVTVKDGDPFRYERKDYLRYCEHLAYYIQANVIPERGSVVRTVVSHLDSGARSRR